MSIDQPNLERSGTPPNSHDQIYRFGDFILIHSTKGEMEKEREKKLFGLLLLQKIKNTTLQTYSSL